jgi:beta-galactosidase
VYFGVDYYPEHWDIEMMDEDMSSIRDMGSNIIRCSRRGHHRIFLQVGD